jgi:hypothetical protein
VKLSDFKRFKKLMMMTMSGADQEALTAIRHANAMLVAEKSDWDRVLDMKVTLEVEDGSAYAAPTGATARRFDRGGSRPIPSEERAAQIDAAFAAIWASEPTGSYRRFVADVQKQWREKGRLTDNQVSVILDGARKVRSER